MIGLEEQLNFTIFFTFVKVASCDLCIIKVMTVMVLMEIMLP